MLYPQDISKRAALLGDACPPAPQRWRTFGVASLTATTQHVLTHSGSPKLCYTHEAIVRPPSSLKVRAHLLHSGATLANLLHTNGAS